MGKVLRAGLRFADLSDLCLEVDAPRGNKATKNSMSLSLARHHLTVAPIAQVAALLEGLSPAEAAVAGLPQASPQAATPHAPSPAAAAAAAASVPAQAAAPDAVEDAASGPDSAAVAAVADLLNCRTFNQLRKEASARGIRFRTRPTKALLVETLSLVLAKESVEGEESEDDESGDDVNDEGGDEQGSPQVPAGAMANAAGIEEDDADDDVDATPAAAAAAASAPAPATTAGGLLELEPLTDAAASIARHGIADPAEVAQVKKDIRGRSHAWLANALREHGVDAKPSFTRQQVITLLADQCAFEEHEQRA
mgnify:CR=1 FL=1